MKATKNPKINNTPTPKAKIESASAYLSCTSLLIKGKVFPKYLYKKATPNKSMSISKIGINTYTANDGIQNVTNTSMNDKAATNAIEYIISGNAFDIANNGRPKSYERVSSISDSVIFISE